jgi:hypothetical protein
VIDLRAAHLYAAATPTFAALPEVRVSMWRINDEQRTQIEGCVLQAVEKPPASVVFLCC